VIVLARLHGLALRASIWALLLPVRALWGTAKTILALLGEESRRWTGLVLWGLVLWPVAQLSAAWYRPLLPYVLLAVLVWLWACARAVRWTLANRLVAVRTREFYKRLDKTTGELGGKITEAVRNARQGEGGGRRPFGGMRHGDRPRQAERTTMDLAEVEHATVEFEPVFPLPWRRRRR